MAERSLLMKADGDARAGTCGKLSAAFQLKSADFSTVYRVQQLSSTAAEAIFHFSGCPNYTPHTPPGSIMWSAGLGSSPSGASGVAASTASRN
jgi:hypothetical protein